MSIIAKPLTQPNYGFRFPSLSNLALPNKFIQPDKNLKQKFMQQFTLKTLCSTALLVLAVMVSGGVWGQVNISTGNTITESFTIGTSATATMPTGWKIDKNTTVRSVGDYLDAGTATERRDGNSMSSSAGNGIYNFAAGDAASATDRAVGGLSSSSASKSVNIYVQLSNNGATNIENFTISYNVEKYRKGSNAAGFSIQMFYSTDGSSWTSAGSDFLTSFGADADNTGYATAPGETVSVSDKTLSQSLAPSSSIYLAWNYSVTSGTTTSNAQALGIDDVEITANAFVGNQPPLVTNITQNPSTGFTSVTTVSVSADVSDSDGTIEGVELHWGTSSGVLSNTINMTNSSGNTFTTVSDIPAQLGGTTVYYEVYAIDDDTDETTSAELSYTVNFDQPTNHVTGFGATANSHSQITVSWTDAVAGDQAPAAYLVKAAVDPATPTAPADGTAEADGSLVKNVNHGSGGSVAFTGLDPETTYNFAIWPYTNSGANIDYKTDGTVPTANATTNAAPPVPKIFISEYLEGASNNKAIEIYNGEDVAIDLTLLTVNLYSNGSATVSSTWTGASGTLAVGSSYILFNSSSITAIKDIGNESSGISNFNGDDALEIVYNGITTDVFGQIGTDPGTGWAVAGTANATVDQTLIRKLSVSQGNVNNLGSFGSTAEDSEWIIQPIDYLGNLGAFASGWKGTTSTVWSVETNWDAGVPSATNNIIINDVDNNPLISDYREVNNATIRTNGLLTIESNGSLDISGTLTNNAGASGLVIESTGAGTGSLITSGTVTGDITVQRYIPGASEDWHLVSSPVSGQGISGDWIPAGTYPDDSGYDFYAWHEDGQIWVNRKNTTASPNGGAPRFDDASVNGNLNFNAARGYMTAYQASNPTKAFTGAPFNANQTYTLSRSGTGSYTGLNLVGNPFPATIAGNVNADGTNNFLTANAAVLDDSFEAYYYWDTPSEDYVAVNQSSGAHFIEVGQGFFVVASADDAVLNFNTNLRKHGTATFYKNADNRNALKLTVLAETGKRNQTELVLDPAMSIGLDPGYDAAKLQGNTALSLYSLLPVPHEHIFDIQSLPLPNEEMIVPIGMTVDQPGVYHLTMSPTEAFEGSILASLYDKQTNTQLQIDGSTSYSFNIGEPGVYNQRFEIHFGALSIDDNPNQLAATAYVHGGQLYILNGKGMTDIRVLDVQGRLLQSFSQNVEGLFNTSFTLPAGLYIIQLQDAQGVRNNKVIKQ